MIVFVFLLGVSLVRAAQEPEAAEANGPVLQEEGGPTLSSMNLLALAGSKADQLFHTGGETSADDEFKVHGVLVDASGAPVADKTLYLFPVFKGIAGFIAMVDDQVINASGTTDEEGRFTLTAGPLWKEAMFKTFVVGTYTGKPGQNSLATIHPIAVNGKAVEREASAETREVDLGTVRLE